MDKILNNQKNHELISAMLKQVLNGIHTMKGHFYKLNGDAFSPCYELMAQLTDTLDGFINSDVDVRDYCTNYLEFLEAGEVINEAQDNHNPKLARSISDNFSDEELLNASNKPLTYDDILKVFSWFKSKTEQVTFSVDDLHKYSHDFQNSSIINFAS